MLRSFRRARQRRLAAGFAPLVVGAAVLVTGCFPEQVPPAPTTTTTTTAPAAQTSHFRHVGTFDVRLNGTEVAEIVAASADGNTLFYSDSSTGSVGIIDASDPANPLPAGRIDVGGSPTSVAVRGQHLLVAIDSSESFVAPSGRFIVIDIATQQVIRTIELGGQPDSVRVSPDQRYVTVILENQRDEDLNDGLLPQAPAGNLTILDAVGEPAAWATRTVDLTGIAGYGAEDPEPEYADINAANQAVVSLQENNHLAVIDLATGTITSHFSAGSATAVGVDAKTEKIGPDKAGDIQLVDTTTARREPDTVMWIDGDSFATANEGDYTDAAGAAGGSRSFTVFNFDGTVEYEAGSSFEHAQVRAGHHIESRASKKGGEPEAGAAGWFGDTNFLFVGAERSNVLGVYDVTSGTPELQQVLPTGIGPEGIALVPARGLFAVANETGKGDWPSMVTIYERTAGAESAYPQLRSADDANGRPIPFVAQSGLVADPGDANTLYSVSDSVLGVAYIYTIDVSSGQAVVTDRLAVTGTPLSLDLEGIAVGPGGDFWVATEGATSKRPNAIVRVGRDGVVKETFEIPAALAATMTNSGFEGLAFNADGTAIYGVIQRPWSGGEVGNTAGNAAITKLDPASGEWSFADYALDAVASPNGGWVGLSEITLLDDGTFAVIERDNQLGVNARIKEVYGVDLDAVAFVGLGETRAVVAKTLLRDALVDLEANSIMTPDKLEGLAVTADGRVFIVTDNDGLSDAPGQTVFLNLGSVTQAFGPR